MEVILKQDIKGLGYANDVVKVKPGYGRNFLIPQGMAIVASKPNVKVLNENLKQAAHKEEKVKADAQTIADGVSDILLEIKAKVGDKGKIFGAITTLQIADALKQRGFEVDRKKINFPTSIKEVGDYEAEIDLHKTVKGLVKFRVVPE